MSRGASAVSFFLPRAGPGVNPDQALVAFPGLLADQALLMSQPVIQVLVQAR
jgi:hypothetical protein